MVLIIILGILFEPFQLKMSGAYEKKVTEQQAEIDCLKRQIVKYEEHIHTCSYRVCSGKCDKMEEEIGHIRQQFVDKEIDLIVEYNVSMSSWTTKCDILGNAIGRLRTQMLDKEMEHQAERETMNNEIRLLQQLLFDKELQLDFEQKKCLQQEKESENRFKRLQSMLAEMGREIDSFRMMTQCRGRKGESE